VEAKAMWMSERERSMQLAEQKAEDVKAWLLIGAIFLGTMLVVWVPLIVGALHS
jgi:hypothetical protein